MIDFFKVKIPTEYVNDLLSNPILTFYDPNMRINHKGVKVYCRSKEFAYMYRVCEYRHLTIAITKRYNVILYGSLHKYFTNGKNYSYFTTNQIFESLLKIETDLKIDLSICSLQNLETTLNFSDLPISTDKIIKGIIGHKVNGSKTLMMFEKGYTKGKGNIYLCERKEYFVKVYDKALHESLPYQLFRYELKYRTNRKIVQATGMNTLYDIADYDCQKTILNSMLKQWLSIILYDNALPTNKGKHIKYRHFYYWCDIQANKDKLYRERKKLSTLSRLKGSNIHRVITNKIENESRQVHIEQDSIKSATGSYI